MNHKAIHLLNEIYDLNLDINADLQDFEMTALENQIQDDQERTDAKLRAALKEDRMLLSRLEKLEDLEDALKDDRRSMMRTARERVIFQAGVLEKTHEKICEVLSSRSLTGNHAA